VPHDFGARQRLPLGERAGARAELQRVSPPPAGQMGACARLAPGFGSPCLSGLCSRGFEPRCMPCCAPCAERARTRDAPGARSSRRRRAARPHLLRRRRGQLPPSRLKVFDLRAQARANGRFCRGGAQGGERPGVAQGGAAAQARAAAAPPRAKPPLPARFRDPLGLRRFSPAAKAPLAVLARLLGQARGKAKLGSHATVLDAEGPLALWEASNKQVRRLLKRHSNATDRPF
jgi:hypothetical protein